MHSDNPSSTFLVAKTLERPSGAILQPGRGIESVAAAMKREFERSRSYGPTMKAIRQVADDFVHEIEGRHLGEGLEIIDDGAKKPAIPLTPLVDRAAPILERLANTPMLRKRPVNVWTIEDITTETPEKLFGDALVSLGHEDPRAEATKCDVGPSFTEKELPKRSFWRKKIF
jgi:hypothetical protein